MRSVVVSVAALLTWSVSVAGCAVVDGGSGGDPAVGVVQDVVDGDTIVVEIQGRTETVRLLGIDTPETVHPTKPVECFGPEASDHLGTLLPHGTEVRLARDIVPRDDYGRLLAHIYRVDDGLFVNADMLRGGYAEPLSIEPNVATKRRFAALSREARELDLGLWGACRPT